MPQDFKVATTNVGIPQAVLTWTDVSGETAYRVQCSYDGGAFTDSVVDLCGNTDANPTAANVTSYDAGCNCAESAVAVTMSNVRYRIRSENAFGNSDWSTVIYCPPMIEVTFEATYNVCASRIDLSWSFSGEEWAVNDIEIWRNINGGGYSLFDTLSDASLTTSIDDSVEAVAAAALMQPLLYKVRYVNPGGNGPFSNEDDATN